MPKGSNIKKGMRPAGRAAGTPNKRTKEALEQNRIAQQMAADVRRGAEPSRQVRKLAKEMLDDFMHTFAGMAATFQPLPDGMAVPAGRKPDENKFLTYSKLAIEAAKSLAPYQSPTYKAIQIVAPPGPGTDVPALPPGNDNILNDPQAIVRHYQRTMKLVQG